MKVVAVKHSAYNRDIEMFKLDDNRIVDYDIAITMINNGEIEGCIVRESRFPGRMAIASFADGILSNNLNNLPEIPDSELRK